MTQLSKDGLWAEQSEFPAIVGGLGRWAPPEGMSLSLLWCLKFFGDTTAEVYRRANIPRAPSGAHGVSVSVQKLHRWVGAVKLELAASVLHAAAMELCFNDRVSVLGCELI